MKVKVKICGVTSAVDASKAARLGADAIGVNFYLASKRGVSPEVGAEIVRALPPFVETVGVFVESPFQQVFHILEMVGRLHTFQWHGTHREMCAALTVRFIPAFGVRDPASLADITRYLDLCRQQQKLPAAVLVDAHVPGQYGGTGQTAPWRLLADFQPGVPLILAGGLTPANVAEAIDIVHPYAVDVASGVESSPGVKDPEKMQRFIDIVHRL